MRKTRLCGIFVGGGALSASVWPEIVAFVPVFGLITAVGGGAGALGCLVMRLLPDIQPSAFLSGLDGLSVMLLLWAVCLPALAVSYPVSLHVMEMKEY